MNFYQAMQLDVSVCKGKIRNAANPSERHKLIAALIVKDILCVLFAVVFFFILFFKLSYFPQLHTKNKKRKKILGNADFLIIYLQ